jgi:hypothetical protein
MFLWSGVAWGAGAWWKLSVSSNPSVLVPGQVVRIDVLAANVGDAPAFGESVPVRVGFSVPSWVTPTAVEAVAGPAFHAGGKTNGGELGEPLCVALPVVSCSFGSALPAFGTIEVFVTGVVSAAAPASGAGEALVEGGGTRPVSRVHVFSTGESTPFGLEDSELVPENEGGSVDLQAGSHPFQLSSTIGVNEVPQPGKPYLPIDPELVKDLVVKLPRGLVGDANAVPQCLDTQFTTIVNQAFNQCPSDTVVGVALLSTNEPRNLLYKTLPLPIFNLTAEQGEPARFGFDFEGLPVVLNTSVRTGEDYGVTVTASDTTEVGSLIGSSLVFWGVPGDARHDSARGWSCVAGDLYVNNGDEAPPEACVDHQASPVALLTLPPSCGGSLQSSVVMDSWEDPGVFTAPLVSSLVGGSGQMLGLGGCNSLPFAPSVTVSPDQLKASVPSGYTVDVHVPQEQALTPNGVAPADAKSITVTLPPGVVANPSVANGLSACSLLSGREPAKEALEASGSVEGINLQTREPANCPEASKIATAEVVSPLLNHVLDGSVYVAAQNANPFGSLLALYLVVNDPISGVTLKLAGQVSPNPVTGQLTVTFSNLPELPFEDATIRTFNSQGSALSTPSVCGSYGTVGSLLPSSGEAAASVFSSFELTPGDSGCSGVEGFAPGFQAGTSKVQAGGYSPLATTVTHPDGDQPLGGIDIQLPPGLEANVAKIPLCAEPAAAQGQCSQASLIGHVSVQAGLGDEPVTVEGGEVFLTGPYAGAPFGLSIVTTAKAGPFNLGVVVVRAAVTINPQTAAVSVVTGAIPTILQGIPLALKLIKVETKEGFVFNPTSCDPMKITGSISSAQGVSAAVSSSFQTSECSALGFKPRFVFSTTANHTKVLGADLHVKIIYPKAAFGSQANIAKVKVDLPIALPTRQSTYKYACVAAVFAANPKNCPPHSIVGTASATTPVLPVPVKGDVYLVSHAGEAFPNLVMVLQGYGVTVDLTGTTLIKKGITSNTFASVPDVPVSSFELTFPQGKYSILSGYGNFCKTKLEMPSAFVAQNGVETHETPTIAVTGCPKPKPKTAKAKKASR